MKAYRRILAALAALILCFSMSASAWAADAVPTEEPAVESAGAAEPVEADNGEEEISFE